MGLIELQNKIHQQNVEAGWWDKERSFSRLTNLGVSEISEAVEAHRKNLNDDKLTKYHGIPVEAVDGAIRTLDVLCSLGNKGFECSTKTKGFIKDKGDDVEFLMSFATYQLTTAWANKEFGGYRWGCQGLVMENLRDALFIMFEIVRMYNLDPISLILEKLEYNKNRPDHQIQNRQQEHGKQY